MRVRPARRDELGACAALYHRVVRETFTWLPTGDAADRFLEEAKEEEVYVAEVAGRLVGLACFYRPDDFLHSLYIEQDARGAGVGSALLAHVRSIAKGPVSLKVQKLNTDAIAFYRARGMEIVEEGGLDDPGGGWWGMSDPDWSASGLVEPG
jgi:GNAT superfamily N-acetyltransferase